MTKSILHLDLHPIAKSGKKIDETLIKAIDGATTNRLKGIEIIPGKGSGQLMKRVKKFLQQPEIKLQYKRIDVDSNNHGRLLVYLR
jgi:DNA-nicking Smr family endonuclease